MNERRQAHAKPAADPKKDAKPLTQQQLGKIKKQETLQQQKAKAQESRNRAETELHDIQKQVQDISSLEEIRGKICRLGSKPALLRRLGPRVTKEELESLHQKNESVTRIFEKMLLLFLIS